MQQRPFFWSSPEFGGQILKVWTEIDLPSLTKLHKKVLPPQNFLNQQKIDAYIRSLPVLLFCYNVIAN